jgi:uncharacterized protein VcgC/VcgE DUF2780
MIDDLIAKSAAAAGMTEDRARTTLSAALGLMKTHADPAKLAELFQAVPEAEGLAVQGQAAQPKKGGGLFGGLMKTVGGSSGAAMADAMAMASQLNAMGISNGQLKRLLPVAEDWVRERTGRDLLREVFASVPGVGGFLDKGAKT